jgi:hypothetical protein
LFSQILRILKKALISVQHSLKIIEVLPMVIMYMSPQAKKEMSLHNFKNVKFVNII